MTNEVQRLRDPIHGLIVFKSKVDKVAWQLIDTPEFQRLRRIRQLGFSEFTFPGATHTRFAHSIGVYHNARRLMEVVRASEPKFDEDRANIVLLAALLHDIGHGPFSHAFEKAREDIAKERGDGPIEKHEKFSAKIIESPSNRIFKILESFKKGSASDIARLLSSDDPSDIYHAVVSSSFDADRLDFLVRDKYMTGTGAGSIDTDWLIDNLETRIIDVPQDDDEPREIPAIVFRNKGRQAAEDFLLARYRLYTEVYLHKTTRGFEAMLSRILRFLGGDIQLSDLNLSGDEPLVKFLRGNYDLNLYMQLDDFSVWEVLKRIAFAKNPLANELSRRLLNREHLFVLDLFRLCGDNDTRLKNAETQVERFAGDDMNDTIFLDAPSVNLYSMGAGEEKEMHKVVRVLDGSGVPQEIAKFPESIISDKLTKKRRVVRYFFMTRKQFDSAKKAALGG